MVIIYHTHTQFLQMPGNMSLVTCMPIIFGTVYITFHNKLTQVCTTYINDDGFT